MPIATTAVSIDLLRGRSRAESAPVDRLQVFCASLVEAIVKILRNRSWPGLMQTQTSIDAPMRP
jgi:hypothetical protein